MRQLGVVTRAFNPALEALSDQGQPGMAYIVSSKHGYTVRPSRKAIRAEHRGAGYTPSM